MAAFVATSIDAGAGSPFSFFLETINLPNCGDRFLRLSIDPKGIADNYVVRVKRTYEPSRLVELAAIAIAGLALFQAGNHEIRDIALRGTGADYLVDETNQLPEIAGRSRKSDFNVAWQQRRNRLNEIAINGYYLCVVEFETPSGRLEFFE